MTQKRQETNERLKGGVVHTYLPCPPALCSRSTHLHRYRRLLTFFLIPPLVSGSPPLLPPVLSHITHGLVWGDWPVGRRSRTARGKGRGYLDGTCVTEPPQKFNGKRKKQLCDDDNTPLLFFLSSSFAPLSPHLSSGMHLIHLVTQP